MPTAPITSTLIIPPAGRTAPFTDGTYFADGTTFADLYDFVMVATQTLTPRQRAAMRILRG